MATQTKLDKNKVKVLKVKRISKNGRYYDLVTYIDETGKKKTLEAVWRRDLPKEDRIKEYSARAKTIENEQERSEYLYKKADRIQPTSPRYSKKKKGSVFYQSFIRVYIVIRYRNQTPFYYPKKGRWTTITRSRNVTERGMLLSCLNEGELEELKFWLEKGKTDPGVQVFHGWTYKRIISTTGSFNGDTKYLDWFKREFVGSATPVTVDFLQPFRKRAITKELRL